LVKDSEEIRKLLKMYTFEFKNYSFIGFDDLENKLMEINKFHREKPRYLGYVKVNKLILQAKNKRELNKIRTRLNKKDFGDLGKYESILFNEIEKAKKN
jgi:predicted glycosyltransferase